MTDHYAVVGNPVAHSVSPQIHAEFARQTGQDLDYVRLLAPLDGFAACIADFRSRGGKGVNVTLPFKLEAYRLAGKNITIRASAAQAVNTLKFNNDGIFGDNTDGIGLIRDLKDNLHFDPKRKQVLLIGAGGAARGVLLPTLLEQPDRLVIVNRTASKAAELQRLPDELASEDWGRLETELHAVADFRGFGKGETQLDICRYDELTGKRFDLVINATSASVGGELPPLPEGIFAADALAYDLMYGREPTPFMKFARERGAKISDGIGMLVEQAAESFFIWRGVRPQTAPVIALLKAQDRGSRIED